MKASNNKRKIYHIQKKFTRFIIDSFLDLS